MIGRQICRCSKLHKKCQGPCVALKVDITAEEVRDYNFAETMTGKRQRKEIGGAVRSSRDMPKNQREKLWSKHAEICMRLARGCG
jgi:hypothetical protein